MNDAPATLLEARRVTKSYLLGRRTLKVLKEIDLQVARGAFIALRGASGAGKSTLLHLLGGLDRVDSGEVLLDGKDLSSLSRGQLSRLRNRRVGFIFQAYLLLPELDALERSFKQCDATTERVNDKLYAYTQEDCSRLESLLKYSRSWLRRPANLEDLFIQLTGRSLRES
jgi:ABC-type lipoprotein export system ATPase subunit